MKNKFGNFLLIFSLTSFPYDFALFKYLKGDISSTLGIVFLSFLLVGIFYYILSLAIFGDDDEDNNIFQEIEELEDRNLSLKNTVQWNEEKIKEYKQKIKEYTNDKNI